MSLPEPYERIVSRTARIAGAAGVPGSVIPAIDVTAMFFLWVNMTREIAKISGHPINKRYAMKLIYSISAGSFLYYGGSRVMTSLLHLIPGAGTVTAVGTNATLNYVYTRILGSKLALQFNRPEVDLKSVALMAASIGSAVFGASVADGLLHTTSGLDAVDSVDLIHGISAHADAGVGLSDHVASIGSAHGEPLFGFTSPGVSYKSTADMVAGRGWSGGIPVDSLGYKR